jgi:murein DD-endopeptidase MepM/ murein hydrolase activator NlpD
MNKRWKYHPFYLKLAIIGLLGVIIFLFFFLYPINKPSFSQGGVFDNTQYLFSKESLSYGVFDINLQESGFLKSSGPPFLVSGKSLASLADFKGRQGIEEYLVKKGDTLSSIAEKFDISLETILWANKLSHKSVIAPGQKLVILPVSGVLHIVRQGDTLTEIAELYQVKTEKIADINNLSEKGTIFAGDLLIIPGGKRPKVSQNYTQVPLSGSFFICPIPGPCRITQGLHWFNAVDFSNGKCSEPVFAAAGGIVQRTGYNSVSGYYVRIIHPNGVVTFYGHLSKIAAVSGERVRQGEIIGYIGHTGITYPKGPAGCHLHFDVRFAKNPFSVYPVGTKLGN